MTGTIVAALVPIALLIGLGLALRRAAFVADRFWPQAERLADYVLRPALSLHSLATARQLGGDTPLMAGIIAVQPVLPGRSPSGDPHPARPLPAV